MTGFRSGQRDQSQGKCLQSSNGSWWMEKYDEFPPEVRKYLQESPFNVCAACVAFDGIRYAPTMITNIKNMEDQIREEEGIPKGFNA